MILGHFFPTFRRIHGKHEVARESTFWMIHWNSHWEICEFNLSYYTIIQMRVEIPSLKLT